LVSCNQSHKHDKRREQSHTTQRDDHDSGIENSGAEYQCHKLSQDEFAYWFDLPTQDPRHPAQGHKQQEGVYSATMFSKPGDADVNGVHLILLDVRYHRSPIFSSDGYCQGANSTMLGQKQWIWLEKELKKPSKIKVIGSALQVMQPTDLLYTNANSYCANDNATFLDAIADLQESELHLGSTFEGWHQIPQEKLRLLRLLQNSISRGDTEKIIIISGDMQWGEMMAKRMPAAPRVGRSQILYEVTASGIELNYPYPDPNANRLKVRSADKKGDGIFQLECKFPFWYKDVEYNDCISIDETKPWCATSVDAEQNYMPDNWGYCLPETDELVPRANITASGENSCNEGLHVCKAQANYGGIEVDWDKNVIQLYIFTPHASNPVAGKVTIGF
jgi:alkaline phosphatase D